MQVGGEASCWVQETGFKEGRANGGEGESSR
jgi:hypothetical protein